MDSNALSVSFPNLSSASDNELLQNALSAWYHAGYQTALYHASLAKSTGER